MLTDLPSCVRAAHRCLLVQSADQHGLHFFARIHASFIHLLLAVNPTNMHPPCANHLYCASVCVVCLSFLLASLLTGGSASTCQQWSLQATSHPLAMGREALLHRARERVKVEEEKREWKKVWYSVPLP